MSEGAAATLADALDGVLVGQDEAKQGLVLAAVAGRHAYLEGPPGCGKTALAEAAAVVFGARPQVLHFHRDVRLQDLFGEPVLTRIPTPDGERIRVELDASRIGDADVLVLDDLSRAPGEALAPLLQVLGARRLGALRLPLRFAVATGVPTGPEFYADPLEPAQLDRFAVQVRLAPLALATDDAPAARVLRRAAEPAPAAPGRVGELDALSRRARALPFGAAERELWLETVSDIAALSARHGGGLVSDRAFLADGVALLRAHAALRAAAAVEAQDFAVLRLMLSQRVPRSAEREIRDLLDHVVDEGRLPRAAAAASARRPTRGGAAGPAGEERGTPREGTFLVGPESGRVARVSGSADVAPFLRRLEGRIDRGRALPEGDPGGLPRRSRSMRRLDEFLDADPVEAERFADGQWPGAPRVLARERRRRGGALAILRDVSASMDGARSAAAARIARALVELGARRRMRIGYVEFHHDAMPLRVAGRLFHRDYRLLLERASEPRADGRTSYEAPLRTALDALGGVAGRDRHLVLLTDGLPVVGDPLVRAERRRARDLGVRVHTVFLARGESPEVLDQLSLETRGLRFRGRVERDGGLWMEERP